MRKANELINIQDLEPEMFEFIYRLEKRLGREITITSGFRDVTHPIERSKSKPGEHTEGLAIDVACITPKEFLEVAGEAYRLGCRRIGVSRKSNFIHLGLSKTRPESLWTY